PPLPVPLPIVSSSFFFFFSCHAPHRALHSFPTRRSSDLNPGQFLLLFRPGHAARFEFATQILAALGQQHFLVAQQPLGADPCRLDRKSTRLNSSHDQISYAVFCLKKKKQNTKATPAVQVL